MSFFEHKLRDDDLWDESSSEVELERIKKENLKLKHEIQQLKNKIGALKKKIREIHPHASIIEEG